MARNLTSGFLSIFNAKLLRSAIGMVSLPIIVRVLGPDGYGDYAFLMSTFSLLMILISSGVTEGVQKFVAEERSIDDWRDHVVGFYIRLALVLAAVGALGLAAFTASGLLTRFLEPRFELYFYLLAVYVVAAQLRALTRRSLMGLGLEPYSESLNVGQKVVFLAVALGLASQGFGVEGFVLGNVVAASGVALVGFVLLSRRVSLREAVRSRTDSFPVRELLSFNVLNIVLVLLLMSLFHVDVMMLRLLTGSEQTGYYKAALSLAEYMWLVPIALQNLLLHSASPLWSDGKFDRLTELSSTITRYVFLLTSLMTVGVFALADSFVPLYYGQEFTAVLDPLVYLLPGALGFAMARPLYAINQANGRLSPLIAATGAAAVGNVILNYLLIPTYGMVGASIATSTSYGSMFLLQVACARYLGVNPLASVRPVRLIATVVLTAPVILGVDALVTDDLVSLATVPVIGFAVFAVTAIAIGAIDRSEIVDAAAVAPDPIERVVRSIVQALPRPP